MVRRQKKAASSTLSNVSANISAPADDQLFAQALSEVAGTQNEHEPSPPSLAINDFFAEFDTIRDAAQREALAAQKERAALKNEEFITFALGREHYGMPLQKVREIIKPPALTFLPRQSSYVAGVFSLRGAIVPVLYLAERLGLQVSAANRQTRIIVLEDQDELVGFFIDEVHDVLRLAPGAIEPPPQWKGAAHAELIRGVGRSEQSMVILLDCDLLMTHLRAA